MNTSKTNERKIIKLDESNKNVVINIEMTYTSKLIKNCCRNNNKENRKLLSCFYQQLSILKHHYPFNYIHLTASL